MSGPVNTPPKGTASLPLRQRQLYDELCEARRLGEPTTSAHLSRLMRVHRGVSSPQTHDLLNALRRKRVIELRDDEWQPTTTGLGPRD